MKKELVKYMLIISLLYVFGAVVDAMVEAQKRHPEVSTYINLYHVVYLGIFMVILIPLSIYYGVKIGKKIGAKKTVLLLLSLLPIASAFWDVTFGWIVFHNPLWINIPIDYWWSFPLPSGEFVINIPKGFATAFIFLRLALGVALLYAFFKKILPSKHALLVD